MGVEVRNLDRVVRDLEAAGVQVTDLRRAFRTITKEARTLAVGFAPRRSGALQRSIRGTSAKNYSTISAGGKIAPYAAVINYGWAKRHIKGSGFMQKADAAIRPRVVREIEAELRRLFKERKL
jgi:hypothetical protein